jgi:hypothetical protein
MFCRYACLLSGRNGISYDQDQKMTENAWYYVYAYK